MAVLARLALTVAQADAGQPLVQRLSLASVDLLHVDDVALTLGTSPTERVTVVLVQTEAPSDRELDVHVREALDARIVLEQAKGVLAESHQIGLDAAYALLLQVAERESSAITETARRVIRGAYA